MRLVLRCFGLVHIVYQFKPSIFRVCGQCRTMRQPLVSWIVSVWIITDRPGQAATYRVLRRHVSMLPNLLRRDHIQVRLHQTIRSDTE